MRVCKWGDNLAIRLPSELVDALALHEGDDIEVVVGDERVFQIRKQPGNAASLEKLRQFRGRLPANFKFDRDDINAHT